MTFIASWEDFQKAAEMLYAGNPSKVRYAMKYRHSDGNLILKVTDDVVCLQYRTEYLQDVKKIEKLISYLMRQMAAK